MRLLLGAWVLTALSAYADTFEGEVIHITDGDTLTVLVQRKQIKVRLVEIDAPERKQAFGKRSQQSLSLLCASKVAQVKWTERDRYGRILGRVWCSGVDTNTEQVRRGLAWVFDRYVTDRSLYEVQSAARAAKLGLWSDESPVPPWEWRAQRRHQSKAQ
jgi:endonuclease YncB( thermonuclease family)